MAFVLKTKPKAEHDPSQWSPRYWLHKHLAGKQKARSYSRVHASDLMGRTDFCPREYALGMKYMNPRKPESVTTAEQVTWDYGHAVEDLVRDRYAAMGRAWGYWKCLACEHQTGFRKRPDKCVCGSKGFRYVEVTAVSQDNGIEGNLDLFVDLGRPKLTMIEIKSMDKEELKKLVAPLGEHRWRTNLYLRLIDESDLPFKDKIDTERAFVLYVTKGGYGFMDEQVLRWKLNDGKFSPFKDYEIARDDSQTDHYCELAKHVDTYKKTGKVPLGICPTSLVKRAKYCPQFDHCWSQKEMKG